ncbi:MAG TPA: FAD/NAD(P)-binding protein, partial [Polyangiaceae bacterium]
MKNATLPCVITLFEEQPIAGQGTPYRPGWNDPAMLSNIASIEIPPLAETLIGWLERLPARRLADLGLESDEIDDHTFYPRVVLGAFFEDQCETIVERAQREGHDVRIRTSCRVVDAVHSEDGVTLRMRSSRRPES